MTHLAQTCDDPADDEHADASNRARRDALPEGEDGAAERDGVRPAQLVGDRACEDAREDRRDEDGGDDDAVDRLRMKKSVKAARGQGERG